MALDFSVLQGMDPAGAFFRGQEAVRAEADRNLLRQMQMEQMTAQRENMLAQREDRNALRRTQEAEEARRREMFELDRQLKTVDLASKSLFAATAQTYPAVRDYLARVNPQFGASLPQEYDEATVKAIAKQGMGLKEQLDAALGRQRYMSTPYGPFDIETGQFRMPDALPSRAPAPGAAPPTPAAPKPPVGYRFTDGGNLEPIPGGPAAARAAKGAAAPGGAAAVGTPAQQAKAAVQQDAREKLSQDLTNQLGYYEQLAKIGAMVSPGRPAAANIAAYARASGVGQETERALGTQAQTLRDNIANARQRLLMHVKNATGATASQMNSNVELQTWLNSLTNPQQSIETVRETLGQLDAVLGSVRDQVERDRGGSVKKPAAAPAAAPAAGANPYQSLSNDELLKQLGVKPGGR